MPFRSKAQAKYLWANHPEVAREFASKTPNEKFLPDHVPQKLSTRIKKARRNVRQSKQSQAS